MKQSLPLYKIYYRNQVNESTFIFDGLVCLPTPNIQRRLLTISSDGHDFRLSLDNAREIGVRLPVREFLLSS